MQIESSRKESKFTSISDFMTNEIFYSVNKFDVVVANTVRKTW